LLLLKLFFSWVFVNDCPNQTQISTQDTAHSAQNSTYSAQNSTYWKKIFPKAQVKQYSKEIMQITKHMEEGSRQSSRHVPRLQANLPQVNNFTLTNGFKKELSQMCE
jgi:hypothetical protein